MSVGDVSTTLFNSSATFNVSAEATPYKMHSDVQNSWIMTKQNDSVAFVNNVVYYSILFPVALGGNIFTIIAVIMVLKIKKSIPNLLIGVLACADLMSLLTCHLISVTSMAKGYYVGSKGLCNFQSMMAFTYFKLGFFTKCNISLDRYIALTYPLRYRSLVTMNRVITVVIINVIFGFLTSALTLIFDPQYIKLLDTWYLCINNWQHYTEYKLGVVIVEGSIFFIGVILFFLSNITVIKVMFQLNRKSKDLKPIGKISSESQSISVNDIKFTAIDSDDAPSPGRARRLLSIINFMKNESSKTVERSNGTLTMAIDAKSENGHTTYDSEMSNANVPNETNNNLSKTVISTNDNESSSSRTAKVWKKAYSKATEKVRAKQRVQTRQKKELKFAKLVMVIVTVFSILWIPYMCVIYYEHSRRESIDPYIEDIAIKLVFANACINPILYGVFNANFRKAYIYYIRMLSFYLTCRLTQKPSGKDMPWTVKINRPSSASVMTVTHSETHFST